IRRRAQDAESIRGDPPTQEKNFSLPRGVLEEPRHEASLPNDRLVAVRPGRDEPHLDARLPLEELDIGAGSLRQVLIARDPERRALPARKRLVDRLDLAEIVDPPRDPVRPLAAI